MANQPSKSTTASMPSKNTKMSTIPQLAQLDERISHVEHYYELMLESCERLFDNEIDQHGFERCDTCLDTRSVSILVPDPLLAQA